MKTQPACFVFALSFVLMGFMSDCFGQGPEWEWARKAVPAAGSVMPVGIGTDAAGNIYMAGFTSGGADFGIPGQPPLPLGMVLVNYSTQGMPLWVRHGKAMPIGFATDQSGNTYVTGKYNETLTLGSFTLLCEGKWDMFVAKYDADGNVLWAKRAGGAAHPPGFPGIIMEEDEGRAIGVDAAGNVYVSASLMTSDNTITTFDTIAIPHAPSGTSMFGWHHMLAKYNPAGDLQWVRKMNPANEPVIGVRGMAVNGQGDCYLIGMFSYTVTVGTANLVSNGLYSVFYARYDASGDFNWARSFGGSGITYGEAIAVNPQGEVYLTGSYEQPFQIGTFSFTGAGDMYLIKTDSNGNPLWASQVTGTGLLGESRLAVDYAGNSYVSCMYSDSLTVGQQVFQSASAHPDPLVIKFNGAGVPEWGIAAHGWGTDWAKAITLDATGTACYLTGTFDQQLHFFNHSLSTGGGYLAKIVNLLSPAPEEVAGNDVSVYPNPAHRRLHLSLPAAAGTVHVQLTDVRGQLVHSATIPANQEAVLDLPTLAAGMYFLMLPSEGGLIRKKIIIQ